MTKLLIVESPAKSKTIEKYLGSGWKVLSSVGHIRDIPRSASKKANAVDIEAGFVPNYQIIQGKEKIVSELKKEARKAEKVFLATDRDREGEAISWHLKEALGLKEDDYSRITFNEITQEAVLEALKNPRKIDDPLRIAQEARRILDRLFGYGLSALVWKKVRYGLSAGRVQSPALRILAEKEREIQKFNPETYWNLTAECKNKIGKITVWKYWDEVWEKSEIEKIQKICEKEKTFLVKDIKERERSRKPNAPFTTSTLQQTASNYLSFSPSKTMRAAQKLYESGKITYMRTDSPSLAKKAISEIASLIEKEFGKKYLEIKNFKSKSKNSQEAHEAIRPTNFGEKIAGRTADEKNLYDLIWKRTVASQMAPSKSLGSKMVASNSEKIKDFYLSGTRLIFPGWLAVFPEGAGEDIFLPEIKVGEQLDLLNLLVEEKETSPPNRYTEAGLIKELEKREIGRPSTYASTIKTLKDREYVRPERGRTLFPTDLGMVISTFLEKHFQKYISDDFTSGMERDLDQISEGKKEYLPTISDFYYPFSKEIASKEDIEKLTTIGKVEGDMRCPKCDSSLDWKLSRSGKFMSCSRFPDCNGSRTEEGKEMAAPKELGKPCPKCAINEKLKEEEKGGLIQREGRYGMFIACSRYPKCKHIEEDEESKKANSTGIKCTECSGGEMTKRVGRFGEFYSCSSYPDCKHAIKTKPTGNLCPFCSKLMMEGTKTIPERCSVKTCPNHRPDKLEKENKKK